MGLASVYRKYSLQGEGGREASKQISWIKDKLLHIYYQNSIDDRFAKLLPLVSTGLAAEPSSLMDSVFVRGERLAAARPRRA